MSITATSLPVMSPPLHPVGEELILASKMGCTSGGKIASAYLLEQIKNIAHDSTGNWAVPLETIGGVVVGGLAAEAAAVVTFGLATGPAFPLAMVAGFFLAPIFSDNRKITIIIVNQLDEPLNFEAPYLDCGVQTGFPSYQTHDPVTKRVIDGTINQIPAARTIGNDCFVGVGIYAFEKDLSSGFGFYGTGGVLTFTSASKQLQGEKVAIAWLVPQSGDPSCAMTNHLVGYGAAVDNADKAAFFKQECDNKRQCVAGLIPDHGRYKVYAFNMPEDMPSQDVCTLTVTIG